MRVRSEMSWPTTLFEPRAVRLAPIDDAAFTDAFDAYEPQKKWMRTECGGRSVWMRARTDLPTELTKLAT